MSQPSLAATDCFSDSTGSTTWRGRHVTEKANFSGYLRHRVYPRLRDADGPETVETALQALATTGMASDHLAKLLRAVPEPHGWELGEALAECVLQDDFHGHVCWPWNTVRDRRTPRASLPGADLVGFLRESDAVFLLIGEVKTSSDRDVPPQVMYGGSGLVWQLRESASRLDVHYTLLAWLQHRCITPEHKDLFQRSVSRYLTSGGKELLLVGVLVRDTVPDEKDLQKSAKTLAQTIVSPTTTELVAWYLPEPISDWAAICKAEDP